MPIGLVVHGGAGSDFDKSEFPARQEGMRGAVQAGWSGLANGGSAMDAVEAAVRFMESYPLLNAGTGGVPNRDGEVELDALVMDGKTMNIGAVAAVRRVEHPVTLARYVMERTRHHLLAAAGAELFATEQGMPLVDPASLLVSPEQRQQVIRENSGSDTVGAVALDQQGNLAVAVSTGGIRGKLPGRVGDSPIAGAGSYADNMLGAACATGLGEGLMRSLLTFRMVESLAGDADPQVVAMQMLDLFTQRFQGIGGFIAIDKHGRIAIAHNTPAMPVGYCTDGRIFTQPFGQGLQGK